MVMGYQSHCSRPCPAFGVDEGGGVGILLVISSLRGYKSQKEELINSYSASPNCIKVSFLKCLSLALCSAI